MFSIAVTCKCSNLKGGGVHGIEFPVAYAWTLGLSALARALKKSISTIVLEDLAPFLYCRDCKEMARELQSVEMFRLDQIAPVVLKNMRAAQEARERLARERSRQRKPVEVSPIKATPVKPPVVSAPVCNPQEEVIEGEAFEAMLAAEQAHNLKRRPRRSPFEPRMPRGGDWRRPKPQRQDDDDERRYIGRVH